MIKIGRRGIMDNKKKEKIPNKKDLNADKNKVYLKYFFSTLRLIQINIIWAIRRQYDKDRKKRKKN